MESAFSLMQLAKTSGKLSILSEKKIPYISVLTNPTFGGATASFSMLGDINIAEPQALIGFAGPRVIKETIGKNLPEGFQTSEFVLEKGFLDFIVERKDLKNKINQFLSIVYYWFFIVIRNKTLYLREIIGNNMNLNTINKKEIFKTYGSSDKDTGSTEVQLALFTERIKHITKHLKHNHKDYLSKKIL